MLLQSCSLLYSRTRSSGFRFSRALHGTPLAAHRAARPGRGLLPSRIFVLTNDAEQEGQSSAPPGEDAEARAKAQLQQTMAGLDALLGIQEEAEPEAEEVGPAGLCVLHVS